MQLCEFRCSMPCNIAFEELFRNVHPNETAVQFPAFCILMEDLHFLFGVVQPISPHSFPSQLRFKAQLIQSLRWLSEPAGLELVRETFRSQPVQAMSILANSLAPYYHKWSGSSLYSLVCWKSVQRYQTLNEKTVTKLFSFYRGSRSRTFRAQNCISAQQHSISNQENTGIWMLVRNFSFYCLQTFFYVSIFQETLRVVALNHHKSRWRSLKL